MGEKNSFMQQIVAMFPFILIFGMMFFIIFSNGRKEKKKKAELLSSLKKDLKIQTIGGITGTIEEVRDNEVLVNVDPGSNTKITFSKTAISSIVT